MYRAVFHVYFAFCLLTCSYILALKEEMARAESRRELCKCSGLKVNTQQGQSAEHTILSLRNIVEKLRSENKFLKDGRHSTESRSSTDSSAELARLQQLHADAVERIAALQQELKQGGVGGSKVVDTNFVRLRKFLKISFPG